MKSKLKTLFNNSIIFFVSDILTKGISFILVPIYTFNLSKEEYGLVDLYEVFIMLGVPIISLMIFESLLRYVYEYQNKRMILNNSIILVLLSGCLTFWIALLLKFIYKDYPFLELFTIIFLQSIFYCYLHYYRGINKLLYFMTGSILLAICNLLLQLIMIMKLNMGISGYLNANIISLFISIAFLILVDYRSLKYLISDLNLVLIKELMNFGIPLIPNKIMWWAINSASKIIVLIFLGVTANGVLAVSSKIPGLINLFSSVFLKAWQLTLYEDNQNEKIFNLILKAYILFFTILISFLTVFDETIFSLFISKRFSDAFDYIPYFLISAMFLSLSGYVGSIFMKEKKTRFILYSSIIAAIINIFTNLLLINILGLYSVTVAAIVSYVFLFLLRIKEAKKIMSIDLNIYYYLLMISLMLIEILNNAPAVFYYLNLCFLIMLFIFNCIKLIKGRLNS
ncbi:oligosaccharide flippase family protein [Macrococcoides canis]|uniref:lipopolysaccharide biosynthesis protein n=1 Tax=Macrococcoides canis TaxID=1855823 RepID=UPI0013E97E66|nr:polysaccharide biosynthesis C-terminal domain-containing protein [Macrococcus canis]QIH75558.1 oligosaccharide flippase family protein [Macrococcus canis]